MPERIADTNSRIANTHGDGHSHIHTDGNSDSDSHAYTKPDGNSNCDGHAYAKSDCDCYAYAKSDSNCYINGDCDRTAAGFTDATASADTAASPLGFLKITGTRETTREFPA